MSQLGIWSKMFGSFANTTDTEKPYAQYQSISGYTPTFRGFGDNAYASDVVRSTIHAIASNAAKLKPKHVRKLDGEIQRPGKTIERLLSVRPNPHMNAYDFFYKVVTQLYLRSNAFILIQSDGMRVAGFYPIVSNTVELLEYQDELYLKFYFAGGRQMTVHYDEVIHLRRHFNTSDLFGDSADIPLLPTLELINTSNQGIMNAIKSSAFLRGILKFTGMLSPTDMKRQRDIFVKDYMDISNNGGVAAADSKMDYTELKTSPVVIDSKQMDIIEKKVYKFFGIHEGIVMAKYSEDEWNAFYESVLEPLAVQMSLEFTSKVFTDNEQAHGNEIVFEANRLQYASNTTKLSVVTMMVDRGMMSLNQGLEVFNMAPVEDGDKRIISLNFVDASKANEYQVGQTDDPKGKEVDQVNDDDDQTEDG
ncbi:HK97 family phage portal protein [Paenibacillus sp. SORGH_AS306]|uniref:phage portal protein n=1 Tax=unclassified Paenibacillus TaxID=185978 RepID=UPI002784EA86|nr:MULTISPECIES: phage portal protein [unclassified Paenibacillus]MDQ1233341.1 HK97 family phage portal protein [Paenibacillus sp. SORGH_AS_0306]MDR6110382.1 HK97 family phage portal protein [Paenibacillus sp. SORGH_AS_0338]